MITKEKILKIIFALTLIFVLPVTASAEFVPDDEYGYSLDLPEGFQIASATEDGMSYLFAHDRMPVELILKLYDDASDAGVTLVSALSRLGSSASQMSTFSWRNVDCAITQFTMMSQYEGWALSVPLINKNAVLVLLCYAPFEYADGAQQFIISCINSLAIDRGSYYEPGPVTAYAFPKTGNVPVTLEIEGKTIKTALDAADAEAAQFLVECEWGVLSLYANNRQWQEAWQRYYRMIFRDSTGRVKKCAFDIYNALLPVAEKKAKSGTVNGEKSASAVDTEGNAQPIAINTTDPKTALVQMLLSWTQDFSYERGASSTSDFTAIPQCIQGEGNDCDSRAMLLCALVQHMGIDGAMFVSREYSHALFGVNIPATGAKIKAGETEYVLGETTAKVALGLIAQDMSDMNKWLGVTLPY